MKQINETKLIVITRGDISPGYQAVQSSHSIADFAFEHPDVFQDWKKESNSIICLSVKNLFELEKIYNKFSEKTPSVIFYEPDINEKTSICLYGTPDVRKKLRSLPLLLKNNKLNHESK